MRPRGAATVAPGLALALALAACASALPQVPAPAGPTATTSAPTALPAASPRPSPAPSTRTAGGAVEDPALLALLPASIGDAPLVMEDGQFEAAMADPGFASTVEAAAFGTYVTPDDLASAAVIRPLPGLTGEAWYRDWRDSYDEGACEQAGGLARTAEADIGGRPVHIATCAGGLRTYHAWVEERGLLVSAFSIGEGRFGERLLAGLAP